MNRILVIEDDKRLGPKLRTGLCEQGFEAVLTSDGQSALEKLARDKPDLIVLDLGLPDCDGMALLKRIRYGECREQVLILTARDGLPPWTTSSTCTSLACAGNWPANRRKRGRRHMGRRSVDRPHGIDHCP